MDYEAERKLVLRNWIDLRLKGAPACIASASVQQVISFKDWHKKTAKRMETRSLSLPELESIYITVGSIYK